MQTHAIIVLAVLLQPSVGFTPYRILTLPRGGGVNIGINPHRNDSANSRGPFYNKWRGCGESRLNSDDVCIPERTTTCLKFSPISREIDGRTVTKPSSFQSSSLTCLKGGTNPPPSPPPLPLHILYKATPLLLPLTLLTLLLTFTSTSPLSTPYYTDCVLSVLCAVLATAWLKFVTYLYKSETIPSSLSRKLIHTLSIPLFLLTWPFFNLSTDQYAPYVASTVPIANLWKIISAGQGGEDGLGKAVSRSGDEKEILNGPLIYTFILLLGTLFLFGSPASIIGLTQMAAGDGMADIIGRRLGKTKWRSGSQKSVEGTLGFVISATIASTALLLYYGTLSGLTLPLSVPSLLLTILGISVVCGVVETAEVGDDNFTVPISGTLLGGWLIGWTWG